MVRTSCSNIHKLINSIWKKEELYPFIREVMKDTVVVRGLPILSNIYKILSNVLTPYAKEIIGIFSVDFNVTGQLLIIYSALVKYLGKNKNTRQCIGYF
jgi:hypothetical protein